MSIANSAILEWQKKKEQLAIWKSGKCPNCNSDKLKDAGSFDKCLSCFAKISESHGQIQISVPG